MLLYTTTYYIIQLSSFTRGEMRGNRVKGSGFRVVVAASPRSMKRSQLFWHSYSHIRRFSPLRMTKRGDARRSLDDRLAHGACRPLIAYERGVVGSTGSVGSEGAAGVVRRIKIWKRRGDLELAVFPVVSNALCKFFFTFLEEINHITISRSSGRMRSPN